MVLMVDPKNKAESGLLVAVERTRPEPLELLHGRQPGNVEYIIMTEQCSKTGLGGGQSISYVVCTNIDKGGVNDMEEVYNQLSLLLDKVKEHNYQKLSAVTTERMNVKYVRKILESLIRKRGKIEVKILEQGKPERKQNGKKSETGLGKKTETLIVKAKTSYAYLLKNMKLNVDIQGIGYLRRYIRRSVENREGRPATED